MYTADSSSSTLKPQLVSDLPFEQPIDQIAANSTAVFAGSFDKNFAKITGDAAAGFKATAKTQLGAKAISIAADDDALFVLQHNDEIVELDLNDLSCKRTHAVTGFKPTKIVYNRVAKEIWVGDNDGKLNFLSAADFSKSGEAQVHLPGKAVNALVISADGTKIASGDTARKIKTFNTETKAELKSYPEHTDKIQSLGFDAISNSLYSISQDRALMASNLETGKMKKIPLCHGAAKPDKLAIAANGKIFTTGDDCCLRVWQKVWEMA